MSKRKSSDLGVDIGWPPGDKRKRRIGNVTQADGSWLTMCAMAELWPDIIPTLFPYQSTEVVAVLDRWKGEGWGQRGLHELLFAPGSPWMDVVERWRTPLETGPDGPPAPKGTRPAGLRFVRGTNPIGLTVGDLRRLLGLFPDVLIVNRLSVDTVEVGIDYQPLGACMAARMDDLPAWTVGYDLSWPGKWLALFSGMVPADTTLRVVAA